MIKKMDPPESPPEDLPLGQAYLVLTSMTERQLVEE